MEHLASFRLRKSGTEAADEAVVFHPGQEQDYVNKPWAPGEVELRVQWVVTAAEKKRARMEQKARLREAS